MNQDSDPVVRPYATCETQMLSIHAQQRLAQRNLDESAIEYVLMHGRVIRRTGIRFYVLRARDIPRQDRRESAISRLIGTTILVSRDETIITVYRNRRSLHTILRKHKQRVDMRRCRSRVVGADTGMDQG